jgi:hypothetical protein
MLCGISAGIYHHIHQGHFFLLGPCQGGADLADRAVQPAFNFLGYAGKGGQLFLQRSDARQERLALALQGGQPFGGFARLRTGQDRRILRILERP